MNQITRPVPGQQYRHFKGNLYQIITIGIHSETNEEMVVYQALYGDFQVYIRPLDMFLEPIDKEKYPEAKQEFRFQLVTNGKDGAKEVQEKIEEESKERKDINTEEDKIEGVNPLLIRFLDAETYGEKLKIYLEMRDSIDEVILTDVAASLDISTGSGTLEEQYASVQFALHTLAKYERSNRDD
ncbi:MAG: DUF1653 domain-containing protein [Lachnospiraceae bacterium]|nr:DUF1653 domain-containing protein [Lachnospiraceae bacterium]MBP3507618.1 DUF1653 domain-containing protein [Lachnospiraceae bacterium]